MNLIDRDELLSRMVALRHANCDSGVQRISLCNAFIAILDAMPTPTCETCRRGDDDQGKDQCRGPLLREASMCNFWEARP